MNSGEVFFEEIDLKIAQTLQEARTEILVAVAWFTDAKLFEILLEKARLGLRVEVIVADKEDNHRLPFEALNEAGGHTYLIKGGSFGMMHQKFCIIDKQILINGSYNWTVNASRNNQENITILKNQPEMITKFLDQFEKIKANLKSDDKQEAEVLLKDIEPLATNEDAEKTQEKSYKDEFDEWGFNLFLNSAVNGPDKNELRDRGFARAEENNGNEAVLSKHLDSIYHDLLQDTQINEERKNEMRSSILNKAAVLKDEASKDAQRRLAQCKEQEIAEEKNYQLEITQAEGTIEQKSAERKNLLDQVIPRVKEMIEQAKLKIEEIDLETVKPSIKWHVMIPVGFGVVFLTFYLLLFYASTFYTILHGLQDAEAAMRTGTVPMAEIFNSEAFKLAWEKGATTTLMIILFTAIPLGCGMMLHYGKNWGYKSLSLIITLVLDGIIAYKIAHTMYQTQYFSGLVTHDWEPMEVFQDTNFYFVLVLGFVAFLLWGFMLDIFLNEIDRRHNDTIQDKKKREKQLIKKRIEEYQGQIRQHHEEAEKLELNILELRAVQKDFQGKLHYLPAETKQKLDQVEQALSQQHQSLDQKKQQYLDFLDRDQIPVSIFALKDRVSAFLTGWDRFLNDHFSERKAKERSSRAHLATDTWLDEKKATLVS